MAGAIAGASGERDMSMRRAVLRGMGATLVGEVVNYQNIYRLCYIRGPEGILIGLAEQLEEQDSRANPV